MESKGGVYLSIHPKSKNKHFLEPYLSYGERRFLRKKTILYKQGDIGEGFYFLQDGLVKISTIDIKQNIRIIDFTSSGSFIGEQALKEMPYFSTCTLIRDSIFYYFSLQKYNELIHNHPEIKNLIADCVIEKVKRLINNINVKSIPTESQVSFFLLKLIDFYNNVEINLTQQELSDYTGLTRITVYKILKKWEEEGLLSVKNRKIYILKPQILKQYVGSHYTII